jgi:hypothetical protein
MVVYESSSGISRGPSLPMAATVEFDVPKIHPAIERHRQFPTVAGGLGVDRGDLGLGERLGAVHDAVGV